MANSVYDDSFLNEEQKRQVEAFKAEWDRANAAGDQAGMDAAHRAAENVRAAAGYSGGENGGGYTPLSGQNGGNGYTASQLPSYQPQVDQVNAVYDAAREAQLAQLKSAFEENSATLEEQRAAIPEAYQLQRNQTAAQSELAGRSFREYAAASGLNSGAGGQAELARSNQLQGDLSALGRQETAEQRALESQIAQLKIQYQNAVAQAVAQGEYDRAAALLQEYQRAQESAVTTAQAQADENYRAWSAGYQQSRDQVSDAQYQQQLEEARRQADQSQQNWERQFAYGQEQDSQARELEDYQRRLQMAELQAQYGDYSGLQGLGVDTSGYAGPAYTPYFTWPQVEKQVEAGNLAPNVLRDYEYYTGQAYKAGSLDEIPTTPYVGVQETDAGATTPQSTGGLSDTARNLQRTWASRTDIPLDEIGTAIIKAYQEGQITEDDYKYFGKWFDGLVNGNDNH